MYIISYSPRGDANRTYSTIAIHWYFSLHVWLCSWDYRIAGKFGEDFNLAVWRIVKNRQIKFSPIIKHDVIRNTHAHGLSTLQWHYVHGTSRPPWGRTVEKTLTYSNSTADSPFTFQKQRTSGWDLSWDMASLALVSRLGLTCQRVMAQRFCASQLRHKEPLFVLSCTQFSSSVRKTFTFSLIRCALN